MPNQTFIRMIRCPICSGPLHFYMNFQKRYGSYYLKFAQYYNNVYDRRCNQCNRAFKTFYFKNGGKQRIKDVIKHSRRHHELSKVIYKSDELFCDIKHMEEFLMLTPYQERAQDIPFEEGIKIPADFHEEFTEYKKKIKEESLK